MNNSDLDKKDIVTHKIKLGDTTYIVNCYYDKNPTSTVEDKLKMLIKNEVDSLTNHND